jgi:hypothetical protein
MLFKSVMPQHCTVHQSASAEETSVLNCVADKPTFYLMQAHSRSYSTMQSPILDSTGGANAWARPSCNEASWTLGLLVYTHHL